MLGQLQKPKSLCSRITLLEREIPTRREISSHSSVQSVAMSPILRTLSFLFLSGGNVRDIKYKIRQADDRDIQIVIDLKPSTTRKYTCCKNVLKSYHILRAIF